MVDAETKATNALVSRAIGSRQQTTASLCVPRPDQCCVPDALAWMDNAAGDNPCLVVRSLMEMCSPTFQLGVLAHDLTCPLTTASGVPNPCCCSTVTFTLFAACHMCQSHSGSVTTYYSFLNRCGADVDWGRLPIELAANQTASLDIPDWAFLVPSQYNVSWNSTAALQNATLAVSQEEPTHSPTPRPSGISPAVIAAIVSAVGITVLVVVSFYICRIRRRRHQRKGSTAPLLPGVSATYGGSDPNTIHTFGNWQPTTQNASRVTVHRGAVDLLDELSETSLRDPGAPRNPWDKGRKLHVPKYDVERDEYGEIKAVYQVGASGQPVAIARSVDEPPPIVPPKAPRASTPQSRTPERRDADRRRPPVRRQASRKPAPMVTPSVEDHAAGQPLPSASEPQTPHFVIGRDAVFDDEPLPSAAPNQQPSSRSRRDWSLPPPPRNSVPIIAEPTPPTPAQPGMRERARGPLMVRNSNLSSLSGSSSGSPPMAPSSLFLASVRQLNPQHPAESHRFGATGYTAPDGFALGRPPPPSWHRPAPVLLSVVTGSSVSPIAVDSAKTRQLPPIPFFSPLLPHQHASTSQQRL